VTAATTAANDGGGVRRFVPPPRAAIDPQVFAQPLFAGLQDFRDLLVGSHWPSIAALAIQRFSVSGANVACSGTVKTPPGRLRRNS